jgi:hypothetical protein
MRDFLEEPLFAGMRKVHPFSVSMGLPAERGNP